MYRAGNLLAIIIISISFFNCDYKLDKENFVKINPPDSTHPFDINLLNETDTIKIFNETYLKYNFETYGLSIKKVNFTLDTLKWENNVIKGEILVDPGKFNPGYYTLTLTVHTNTGTGSIADHSGIEGYFAMRNWKLLIDGRPPPLVTLTKSITKDGFLRLDWPKCDQYNFLSYSINGSCNSTPVSKLTTNSDSNFYIDSNFIGGQAQFWVTVRVLTNDQSTTGNILSVNEGYSLLNFEDIGIDSIRIFWNKSPYKAKYKLTRTDLTPDKVIVEQYTDTSISIAQPGFGTKASFVLSTSPYYLTATTSSLIKEDFKDYRMGQYFAGRWQHCSYNPIENVIYTNNSNNLECYNFSNLSLSNDITINNLSYKGLLTSASNSTKVAALSPDNIYIFQDKNLSSPVIIPNSQSGADHFFLTNNQKVAIASNPKYSLVDINTQKIVSSVNIPKYPTYNKWVSIATSRDGLYTCCVSGTGLTLYKNENDTMVIIYTDNLEYRAVLFDEKNPHQLILSVITNNTIEIRECTDFSLIKTVSLPSSLFCNIDPVSGYLLTYNSSALYVIKLSTEEILLKITTTDFEAKLYGKRLFSSYGSTLDISKYLPK
jgi:hypothetical protein